VAITSLIVKIGAKDEDVQAALSRLTDRAKTADGVLKQLGETPIGQEALKSYQQMEVALKAITDGHQRMADKAVQAARGLELVGGVTKLTNAELDQISKTLNKGIDAFQAMGVEAPQNLRKMADEAKNATTSGQGFSSWLGSATQLLSAFGVGLSIGAVVSFVKDISAAADSLVKMHDKTGISIEGLQRFQAAGDDAGNTLEDITQAIVKMEDKLVGGDKSALTALEHLGIRFADIKGLSPEAQFIAISDAIRKIQDPAEQVNIAIDLFGKAGANVLPVLKRGFDDLKGSSVGMSRDTVKALDDAGDATGRFWRAVKANLGEAVGDILTGTLSATRRLNSEFQAMVESAAAAAPKMAKVLPPGLPADLDQLDRQWKDNEASLLKAAKANEVAAAQAKKNAAEMQKLTAEVSKLQGGLFLIPDGLHKIGRAFDDSGLGKMADAVGKVEQNAHIANFGFAGMVDSLKNVGKAGEDTTAEMKRLAATFDFTGPIQQVDDLAKAFTKIHGALGDVSRILDNIPGKFAEITSVAARTGQSIIENLAQGDVFGAITSGVVGGIQLIGRLFHNAEKDVNPLRQAFIDTAGGLAALNARAHDAGVTLTAMLNAKNPEAYTKAINDLNAALKFQDDAMATLDATVQKYGFTIEELGPALQRQGLDKQAQGIFQDWTVLNAAGIDTVAIASRMADSINAYVRQAVAMGIEVPAAMRPMLQTMIDQGQLTDAAGNKITSLEDSGISFATTMSEGFKSVVEEVKKLTDAITRGLGTAITNVAKTPASINFDINARWNIPPMPRVDTNFAATGGFVTANGVQHFAAGGRVLPFLKRGTDSVPAMLTPGELVLNQTQQVAIGSALGNGSAALSAVARLQQDLPQMVARATRDAVQKVARRRA
jgi:hypothetical protein